MDLWLLDTPLCVRVDDSPCLWAPCGLMCGVTGRFTCKLPWMSPHFLTCEMVVLLPTVGLKWEDAWFRAVLTGKHSNNELLLQLPLLLDRTCLKAGDGKCVCGGGSAWALPQTSRPPTLRTSWQVDLKILIFQGEETDSERSLAGIIGMGLVWVPQAFFFRPRQQRWHRSDICRAGWQKHVLVPAGLSVRGESWEGQRVESY